MLGENKDTKGRILKWGIYIGLYNIIGLVYREPSVPETYFARTSFKFKPLRTDARQLIYFPKE